MKKIVLLNSSFISERKDYLQRTEPHLRGGVASIAAYLRESGFDVSVIDTQVEELDLKGAADRIVAEGPSVVGFSAYTEEINDSALIAGALKEKLPYVVTVIGGYHVSAMPEETLEEFPSFDAGVIGEGELTMKDIASSKSLKSVNGIVYRDEEGSIKTTMPRVDYADMDTLPPPAWDLFDLKHYGFGLPVELLRACPFSCAFCFRTVGKEVRYKSPERIVDEVERNIKEFGFKYFFFPSGGTFPIKKSHGMEVCREIIKRGLKIKWSTAARVNLLDDEILKIMKESGCDFISLGIESGDKEILKLSGKGTTPELAEEVSKMSLRAGVKTELNFILGLPYETRESLENTRKLVARLRRYSTVANFAILTPFPGTKVYEMALKNEAGLTLKTKDWTEYSKQGGTTLSHDNFADGELAKYQLRLYLYYYFGSPQKFIQFLSSDMLRQLLSYKRVVQLLKRFIS